MSSTLAGKDLTAHRRKVSDQQPIVRKEIADSIEKLLAIVRRVDPLHLLGAIAMHHCFIVPESYRESTDQHRLEYAEYTQSLVLSVKQSALDGGLTRQQYSNFHDLLKEMYANVRWYFGAQIAERAKDIREAELQFKAMMSFLGMRGDAFQEHMKEHFAAIFGPHDAFLKMRFGVSAGEILRAVDAIEEQITDRLNGQPLFEALKELSTLTGPSLQAASSDVDKRRPSEELQSNPEAIRLMRLIQQEADRSPAWVFQLTPDQKIPAKLLDLLSAGFGDNSDFALFEKSPAWPTNNSIIFERPLIHHDGCYYCFLPHLLVQRPDAIFEALVQAEDENYFKTTFQKKRSDHLESVSIEYFAHMLPGAQVFRNVYYHVDEAGISKRPETDAVIIYDQTLIIVEAKSGGVSLAARRGGLESIKGTINDQVAAGYNQGLRTKTYIHDTAKPTFEFEDGRLALALDKSRIKEIIIVVPTLERLGTLSITLSALRDIGLLPGDSWPWCVYINDLRVISEIVEQPSELLLYIARRTGLNDLPALDTLDELDYFMWFLRGGLTFNPNVSPGADKFLILSHTEELDRYYDFVAGRVSTGPKPRIKINDAVRQLIARIEASGFRGFSRLSTLLLSLSGRAQEELVELMANKKAQFASTGVPQSASLVPQGLRRGITIWIGDTLDLAEMERMDAICAARKKSTSSEVWLLLALIGAESRVKVKVYDRPC